MVLEHDCQGQLLCDLLKGTLKEEGRKEGALGRRQE